MSNNTSDTAKHIEENDQNSNVKTALINPSLKRSHDMVSEDIDDSPETKRINLMDSSAIPQIQEENFVEEYKIPAHLVGLIIGRGGEHISRLQIESGCKLQLIHDNGDQSEKVCNLTGTKESIMKARDMLTQIINQPDQQQPFKENETNGTIEFSIPGSKAGLIIGRGGEKIKQLQHTLGVKIMIIQDSPHITNYEKPLRITGESYKCERAKQMIMDIVSAKEEGSRPFHRESFKRPKHFSQNLGEHITNEVLVPKQAVPIVIGKGGEMIKRLQSDSGADIQFDKSKDNDLNGDRLCIVTGSHEQVDMALYSLNDLIQSVMKRNDGPQRPSQYSHHQQHRSSSPYHHGMSGNRGHGRGRRGNNMDRSGSTRQYDNKGRSGTPRQGFNNMRMGGPPSGRQHFDNTNQGNHPRQNFDNMSRGGPPQQDYNNMERGDLPRQDLEIQYSIPASKCDLIIGKGGENIRAINQRSGAYVDLFNGAPPNPNERSFVIRGSNGQVEHAKQLINEMIDNSIEAAKGPSNYPSGGPPPPHFHRQPPHPMHSSEPLQVPNVQSYEVPTPLQPTPYYAQPSWSIPHQQSYQDPPKAVQIPSTTVIAPAPIIDHSKIATPDQNAAWAAYYAFQNNGTTAPIAPQAIQTPTMAPGQAIMQQLPVPQPILATAPATAITASGQPDYSADWAQYYRTMGMIREAEIVEQQARISQAISLQVSQPTLITQVIDNPQLQTNVRAAQIVAPQPPLPTAQGVAPSLSQWGTPYTHQTHIAPATTYTGYGYPSYPPQ